MAKLEVRVRLQRLWVGRFLSRLQGCPKTVTLET
jgi:hypothetical protein